MVGTLGKPAGSPAGRAADSCGDMAQGSLAAQVAGSRDSTAPAQAASVGVDNTLAGRWHGLCDSRVFL